MAAVLRRRPAAALRAPGAALVAMEPISAKDLGLRGALEMLEAGLPGNPLLDERC